MPTVEGPITGGSPTGGPWWATPYDLAPYGYVEQEYFLSGVASDRGQRCTGSTAGLSSTKDYLQHPRIVAPQFQPPPRAPRFIRAGFGVQHDANGNVGGGVPQPAIEVPVATYETESFVGQTIPFDPARLLAL